MLKTIFGALFSPLQNLFCENWIRQQFLYGPKITMVTMAELLWSTPMTQPKNSGFEPGTNELFPPIDFFCIINQLKNYLIIPSFRYMIQFYDSVWNYTLIMLLLSVRFSFKRTISAKDRNLCQYTSVLLRFVFYDIHISISRYLQTV